MSTWVDQKYVNVLGGRLPRFKKIGRDLYRFRCPYCGDSKKSDAKARGHFFMSDRETIFKCHNCGVARGLRVFIKEMFPEMYKEFIFEQFQESKPSKPEKKEEPDLFKMEAPKFSVQNRLLSNFPRLTDGPNTGLKYLRWRKIPEDVFGDLYWIDDVNSVFPLIEAYEERKLSGDYEAIMIPYWVDGNLTYVQLRLIDPEAPLRYMTLEIEGGMKVWGLDRINPDDPTWLFEGPLDAMCIPNSLASGGADLLDLHKWLSARLPTPPVLVWDTDFSTNFEVRSRFEDAVNSGAEVVIADSSSLGGKDVNAAIQAGKSISDVVDYLRAHTFRGLDAALRLSRIRKPKKVTNGSGPQEKKDHLKIRPRS